jgi:NAD(P)-dependent dehydrogenase (short-subunit alcohol dehydrogenase family)
MEMQGTVAIVTGGTGAIGSAVVSKLLNEGATVIVADRAFRESSEERLCYVETDVTAEESVRSMVARVVADHGTVHALFNIAGGFRYGPAIEDLEVTDWESMINLNLKSAFLCMKHVLPTMKKQKYGRIVSVAARSGLKGDPMVAPYAVSKAGVILLTQTAAEENKAYGVTVNAVLPSVVDTPANRASMPDADFDTWVALPDLAEVMIFLASERARAVTGAALPVYHRA